MRDKKHNWMANNPMHLETDSDGNPRHPGPETREGMASPQRQAILEEYRSGIIDVREMQSALSTCPKPK